MRISDWSSDVCSSDLRLELIANGRVADYARRIEHPGGARDEHAAAGPEGHAQCAQHRQPVILREHGAEPARRRAQDRDMAPAEHPRDIARRACGPVNRVLEHAGYPVVIFGRRENHARSDEHTSELQSLMRISYAVFCLKKKRSTN